VHGPESEPFGARKYRAAGGRGFFAAGELADTDWTTRRLAAARRTTPIRNLEIMGKITAVVGFSGGRRNRLIGQLRGGYRTTRLDEESTGKGERWRQATAAGRPPARWGLSRSTRARVMMRPSGDHADGAFGCGCS
jgi:hypothetical protein